MDWFLTTAISNAIVASLLGCIAFVVGRFGRHAAAHAIWVLMLLKLVTPPVLEIPLPVLPDWAVSSRLLVPAQPISSPRETSPPGERLQHDQSSRMAAVRVQQSLSTPEPAHPRVGFVWSQSLHHTVLPWLLMVWGVGAATYFIRQLHVTTQMWRLMRHASPSARIDRALHRVAITAQLNNYPSARIARWLGAPMLWGFGNQSVIVFPAELFDSLDDEAVASLLRHELAHYRRGDQWVRILQIVVTTIYWWHPFVWLAASEMEAAEEQCCDAWVVKQDMSRRRHYAEALLDTVDFLSEKPAHSLPIAASGLGRVPLLQRRLKAIMQGDEHGRMTTGGRIAVIALSAILPVQPLLLPANPAAQETATPDSEGIPYARAISPDGYCAIVAFSGFGAELRDLRTGAVTRFAGRPITCAAFSLDPAKSELVIGSRNGTVELFDCDAGKRVRPLTKLASAIRSVALSPDGQWLAIGSAAENVRLIEFANPRNTRELSDTRSARCVRFSADGNLLAVVADTPIESQSPGQVEVRDLINESIVVTIACPTAVGIAGFRRNAIVTAEWDGTVRLWSLEGGLLAAAQVAKDRISAAAFSPDAVSAEALWNAQRIEAEPRP